jgi:membrane protein DedA with SNARE-associated domain
MINMIEYFLIFIKILGYLGVFLVSVISTSTIFLPTPLYLIIITSSSLGMNPFLVAFFSGLGMTIGELTGYFMGLGGNLIIIKKHKKGIKKVEKFFKKYGFFAITTFAFFPLPFDVIGISAGIGNYDIKRFFLATFIGKFFKALLLAFVGTEIKWILDWF